MLSLQFVLITGIRSHAVFPTITFASSMQMSTEWNRQTAPWHYEHSFNLTGSLGSQVLCREPLGWMNGSKEGDHQPASVVGTMLPGTGWAKLKSILSTAAWQSPLFSFPDLPVASSHPALSFGSTPGCWHLGLNKVLVGTQFPSFIFVIISRTWLWVSAL